MKHTEQSSSQYVEIDEAGLRLRLHYNAAGTGRTVILLHGGGPGASGWSNYSRNFQAFVDAGFHTVLLDCPGFNKSDPIVVTEDRAVVNAKATAGLMNALGIERASLVGNSMGGASALNFALRYPGRLDKLVLMGPAGLGKSLFVPQPTEGIKHLINVFRNPSMESLKRMLSVFVFDQSGMTEELIAQRYESMMRDGGIHLRNWVEGFAAGAMSDLSPRLQEISAPTLCTWGRDDRFLPLDQGIKVITEMPNAALHVFPQCGHWAQWEHADAFNRLVIDFISS